VLVAPASARASEPPWTGGLPIAQPLEVLLTDISRQITERQVWVACDMPTEWTEPPTVSGYVSMWFSPYYGWIPDTIAHLAPWACTSLDAFWTAPNKRAITKECQIGTTIEYQDEPYRVQVKKRVKVRGKWVMRRVWVVRYQSVPVTVPLLGICPDYTITLFAIQTVAHESIHLFGIREESRAECFGMQFFAYTANRLGADPGLAQELATDYYNLYYLRNTPGTDYFDPTCMNDGALDLDPSPIWPRRASRSRLGLSPGPYRQKDVHPSAAQRRAARGVTRIATSEFLPIWQRPSRAAASHALD
jgi:hypothetical protein